MVERRLGGERRACRIAATVTSAGHRGAIACTVENISDRGAKLRFGKAVQLPGTFKLHLPRVGRFPEERAVELRWSLGTVAGVQFMLV